MRLLRGMIIVGLLTATVANADDYFAMASGLDLAATSLIAPLAPTPAAPSAGDADERAQS